MVTSKVLTSLGVKHFIVVEAPDVPRYNEAIRKLGLLATVLELDMSYKEKYETCDSLGLTRSTGPGPARNFAWDHSIKQGHAWHWVMDDNIRSFRRLNKNERVIVNNPAIFRAMEDFVLRYKNIGMAGPNYYMFASPRTQKPPFVLNTRIYSCNLIRNDIPYRWRGRYNEDTILSLDMLTDGWCTVQFNAFLQQKMQTQALKGGNTTEFYHAEGKVKKGQKYADTGTINKSKMLVDVYPQLAKMVYKFSRWHHHVDYSPFKANKLVRREGFIEPSGVNNYGMSLITKG